MTNAYRRSYGQLIQSLRQRVAEIGSYPIRENYSSLVKNVMTNAFLNVQKSVTSLVAMTQEIETALVEYKESSKKLANSFTSSVYNGTYLNIAMQKLNAVKNFDVSPYTAYLEVPEEYSPIYNTVKDYGISTVKSLYERPELDAYRSDINAVYQKSAWAVKYWEPKKTLKENIEYIVKLFIEIVEEELNEMAAASRQVYQPVTYYNPEQGEIQAQLPLPLDVASLQELPDMGPIKARVSRVAKEVSAVAERIGEEVTEVAQEVAVYLPDQTTWNNISKSVSEYFASGEPEKLVEKKIEEELNEFIPSKKPKTKGAKKMNKKMSKKMNKMRQ